MDSLLSLQAVLVIVIHFVAAFVRWRHTVRSSERLLRVRRIVHVVAIWSSVLAHNVVEIA